MRIGLAVLVAGSICAAACQDPTVVAVCSGTADFSIAQIRVQRIEKLDLLVVVDDSSSMADKQAELARSIPAFIAEITAPGPTPQRSRPLDVHVGVITSSLGSHGTSACASNDRGHLLPRATSALCTASPLSWVFVPEYDPGATFKGHPDGAQQLGAAAACVVGTAGEQGCGYEATWEALYHFLVDPAPYAKAEVKCTPGVDGDACGNNKIVVEGVDEVLLAQRRAFLRPDSMLAVIVLSDENDASLKPAGLNWLPWGYGKGQMQRGWSACANVPDDFEPETAAEFGRLHTEFNCWSCFEKGDDPGCKVPWTSDDPDAPSLRAMRQTNRYGYNFLWGRQRYVDAFTKGQVVGSDGMFAPNPIFSGGFRTQELIAVATIVGVPKHLVEDSAGNPKDLTDADWQLIQGPIGKRDPHMIESIAPRRGVPKFAGDRSIDAVNGGDRDVPDGDDLQYACIAPRAATTPTADCSAPNPLCDGAGTQRFSKAYPGLRHVRIAKELGNSGIVGSICSDSYLPVLRSVVGRVRQTLETPCVRAALKTDNHGAVECLIVEAMQGEEGGRSCEDLAPGLCTPGAAPCRRGGDYPAITVDEAAAHLNLPVRIMSADGTAKPTQTQAFAEDGNVYVRGDDTSKPRKRLVCEVAQLAGSALSSCRTDNSFSVDPRTGGGFCYSREPAVIGPLCAAGRGGTVRLLGGAFARTGSEVFTYCAPGGGC